MSEGPWTIDTIIDVFCDVRCACFYLALELAWRLGNVPPSHRSFWHFARGSIIIWSLLILFNNRLVYLRNRPKIRWKEEVAIVTGSSGGLGQAIVTELRKKGCRVAAIDIVEGDQINAEDADYCYIKADVSDKTQIESLPYQIEKKFTQSATIVISNAGIMVGRRVLDFDDSQFERTLAVNFLATYYLVRSFLPAMLTSGRGKIVATCSIMGYISVSQLTDYVASKHALAGFIESLRLELDKKYKAPYVTTTLLVLGKLATPLFAETQITPLAEFLTPTQKPGLVAKALIDQLERGGNGHLYRPYLARSAPLLQALPNRVRRLIQWASGADEALQTGESTG